MSRSASLPDRLVDAGHGLLTGVASASLGVLRGVGVMLTCVAGGAVQCVLGRPREGLPRLGRGLARVAQLPADLVMMLAGRVVSAVQVLAGLEPPGRRLTEEEVARLRPIFGASLDYAVVRVKEGRVGVLGMSGRAFVHGNTVYAPRGPVDYGLLVHELTHVWQHQHGGTAYMSAALAGQWWGDGYNWRKAVGQGLRWDRLNPEQQAQLIEDAALCGLIPRPAVLPPRARLKGWTEPALALLDEALGSLHLGRGAP